MYAVVCLPIPPCCYRLPLRSFSLARHAACNATVMFRKDDRSGQDDSVQQMKLVRLLRFFVTCAIFLFKVSDHSHITLQIGLMMVRNEENRIGWAACALARHVDALVVRDDASDDGTGVHPVIALELCSCHMPLTLLALPSAFTVEELLQAQQRCGFELNLIHAPKPWNFHEVRLTSSCFPTLPSSLFYDINGSIHLSSPQIRTRADLLEAGRASGGTHFIFVDADEILTDNYRKNNRLRELM